MEVEITFMQNGKKRELLVIGTHSKAIGSLYDRVNQPERESFEIKKILDENNEPIELSAFEEISIEEKVLSYLSNN